MTAPIAFLASIQRLLERRGQAFDDVVRSAGIAGPEMQAISGGAVVDSLIVWRLADALGFHAADMFVLAARGVPDDLASSREPVGRALDHIVRCAVRLSPDQWRQLSQTVESMPSLEGGRRTSPSPDRVPYPRHAGGMIVRMLRNRNLDNLTSAKILYRLAGVGPLSSATIASVGSGFTPLTYDLLSGFAVVLGYNVDDLSALFDITEEGQARVADPSAREVAALVWNLRRLTSEQVNAVLKEVRRIDSGD